MGHSIKILYTPEGLQNFLFFLKLGNYKNTYSKCSFLHCLRLRIVVKQVHDLPITYEKLKNSILQTYHIQYHVPPKNFKCTCPKKNKIISAT